MKLLFFAALLWAASALHAAPPAVSPSPLPPPFDTPSVSNSSTVIEWPQGKLPQAPPGFVVTRFATGLRSPRNLFVAPDGQIFVSEARRGQLVQHIRRLKGVSPQGTALESQVYLSGLNRPFGITIIGDGFYVANQDGVWRYPYTPHASSLSAPGKKILDLPAGGYNNHWTRNLLARRDQKKLYVSVGSASNVAEFGMEHEKRRAAILEVDADGGNERVFASGLRNPVGMAWAPGTDALWTVVNERDGLGDELVPDFLTRVQEGGFYGWPYSYFGKHLDPRVKNPPRDLVDRALVPDVSLGAHTAPLGLAFYDAPSFPVRYRGGAFIGLHGSWNRSKLAGYQVVFVPFKNRKPSGPPEAFLTGFIADPQKSEVYGRPVGIAVAQDGSLLVADDGGGVLWRIAATPQVSP